MQTVMERVGKAMREKYYWIGQIYPLYSIMDNAGGHGKMIQ